MPISPAGPDIALRVRHQLAIDLPVADQRAVHGNPAVLNGLKMVNAAQQRGLARARRPDQDDDLAPANGKIHFVQHLGLPNHFSTPVASINKSLIRPPPG